MHTKLPCAECLIASQWYHSKYNYRAAVAVECTKKVSVILSEWKVHKSPNLSLATFTDILNIWQVDVGLFKNDISLFISI